MRRRIIKNRIQFTSENQIIKGGGPIYRSCSISSTVSSAASSSLKSKEGSWSSLMQEEGESEGQSQGRSEWFSDGQPEGPGCVSEGLDWFAE